MKCSSEKRAAVWPRSVSAAAWAWRWPLKMPPDIAQPEFRLATPADAELLLDFMRDYYAFDGHHYDRESARTALLGILSNSGFGLTWLVLDSGQPVGYIVLCSGYSLEYLG